jgi:teichuronic acid biosynthesis glycosyltransferase TuaH
VVILSTADYHASVWTNKQHLASRLAASRDVYYIESFGLRRPRLTLSDVSRIARRLLPGSRRAGQPATAPVPPRLRIISPVVLPVLAWSPARWANGLLVKRRVASKLPGEGYVLWSFSPLAYGLEKDASAVVYHSVDLIHEQPHMPRAAILQAEAEMLKRADAVVASSAGVERHLRDRGAADVRLWENVADLDLFQYDREGRLPRAIFAGNISPAKVDLPLLAAVVDRGVPLAIAGPIGIDGTDDPDLKALLRDPRVDYLGNLAPQELAREINRSTVGLIPYLLNEYTSGVFPMKVYEYLGAGLAVVSTALPSLTQRVPQGAAIARTPAEFADAASTAVTSFTEDEARARSTSVSRHSWRVRTRQAEQLLGELESQALATAR